MFYHFYENIWTRYKHVFVCLYMFVIIVTLLCVCKLYNIHMDHILIEKFLKGGGGGGMRGRELGDGGRCWVGDDGNTRV